MPRFGRGEFMACREMGLDSADSMDTQVKFLDAQYASGTLRVVSKRVRSGAEQIF